MSKQAIYLEEAKRLYVQEGFALDTIVGMLNNKVSRKTLYNWKVDGDWDTKRKNYLKETSDLQADIMELAKLAIKNAKADPTPHNIYAMSKAIAALKSYQGVKVIEDEAETPTGQMKNPGGEVPEELRNFIHSLYGLHEKKG